MVPCGWEIIGCDDCSALTNLSDEVRQAVEERAIARLWEWTNRRFGNCPTTWRPCKRRCAENGRWMWNMPVAGGRYIDLGCGCGGNNCGCGSVSEIILPGPITPVEIIIDGEELPLFNVRVDNWNRLVRLDGEWPQCQDLSLETTQPGTWSISYTQGQDVPPGGGLVAGILACEYAKGMCGDDSCRLPQRVSTVARQGVTVAMLDNFTGLSTGFTGIWEIDDWVMTYQTNLRSGPWQQSTVHSPDLTPQRFVTWEYSDS